MSNSVAPAVVARLQQIVMEDSYSRRGIRSRVRSDIINLKDQMKATFQAYEKYPSLSSKHHPDHRPVLHSLPTVTDFHSIECTYDRWWITLRITIRLYKLYTQLRRWKYSILDSGSCIVDRWHPGFYHRFGS